MSGADWLREIVLGWPVVLFEVDPGGRIVACEGAGLAALPGAAPGVALDSLFPGSAKPIAVACAGGSAFVACLVGARSFELQLRPRPGGGAHVVALDVTERVASAELARRHLFLDSVVENIPNMIFVKDAAELRFVCFNKAGEELLGYRREELIGKNDHDFFPADEADFFTAKDRAVLASGELLDIPEEKIHTKHGERVLHTRKIPIADAVGHPLYLLGISDDITDRKEAERERQQVTERLAELDAMKARLIANVSHELRTPLALILATTDELLGSAPAEGELLRRDLALIKQSGRTLLGLVNDLLDVAKLEAGQVVPNYVAVDLARLVRVTVPALEALARQREVELTWDAPPTVAAECDVGQLQRVLTNLVANAIAHTPAGGRVVVKLAAHDDRARLAVADTGPGVPAELAERVFERFFRARETGGVGTGLGLAIVRELVLLHLGTVHVEQNVGGGACFVVELPLRAPEGVVVGRSGADAGLVMSPPEPLADAPAARFARTHPGDGARSVVLVVEDNPELNRFLVDALARDHDVLSATNGVEGLGLAVLHRPDAILTDVMMPLMSGAELIAAVRARPELSGVPILVLTARDDDELRLRLLADGAQDYVVKPFHTREVIARVANLVAMKRARETLSQELESREADVAKLADQLARRHREVKTALDTATVALEQANAATQLKGRFLALVSHELRTPLTPMRLQVQQLVEGAESLPPLAARGIRRIDASVARMIGLVEALLQYACIEAGRLMTARESIDLAAVVVDVVDELRPQAEVKQLELGHVVLTTLPPLESDGRLVRIVVVNLVANALKFTESGRVAIRLSHTGGVHRIEVEDSGPGIPAEQQALAFEPFETLEPMRHKHLPGVGLGLSLVREIANALGGTISLRSAPGQGSIFTVVLPPLAPTQPDGARPTAV